MRTRSFNPVMAFITTIMMLFGLVSGCTIPVSDKPTTNLNPTEQLDTAGNQIIGDVTPTDTAATEISAERQVELTELAQEWVDTRDNSLFDQIQNEQEVEFVGQLLKEWQAEADTTNTNPPPPPMAACAMTTYWGSQARLSPNTAATKAELEFYGSGLYTYYWSPNCYMAAPGDDCGTDHNDNMVSFWMGPDYRLIEGYYKTDSTNWYTGLVLYTHGGGSYRVYTSGGYGNAYVCLSNSADASTLRFGRVY